MSAGAFLFPGVFLRHRCATLAVLAVTAGVCACDDPENPVPRPVPETPSFQPLTTQDAVLNNIEAAYHLRRTDKYEQLLDADFTFVLSPGDVGGSIPPSWDRVNEVTVHGRLLDPALDEPPYPRCTSIELDLKLDGVVWEPGPGPAAEGGASEEVRYTTTVFYDFTIRIEPDFFYLAVPGSKAKFTVRNTGTDEAPHWQLVEMEDLGAANLTTSQNSRSTQETTWGGVKNLYR
jgi:hypothetical protein